MDSEINRKVDEIAWMPHPVAQGVSIKPLITSQKHDLNVTCMLVNVPVGREVPEHIHQEQDDILFPLQGKAVMWVEGAGDFSLEPGVIVRVPKGKKHRIAGIAEDLLFFDVFYPALI